MTAKLTSIGTCRRCGRPNTWGGKASMCSSCTKHQRRIAGAYVPRELVEKRIALQRLDQTLPIPGRTS